MTVFRNIAALLCLGMLATGQPADAVKSPYRITHLAGTYDLNNDGALEFIAVLAHGGTASPTVILQYYDLDQHGFHRLLWELEIPEDMHGRLVDVKIGDLDGNGNADLVTLLNVSNSAIEGLLQPVVFVFAWDGDGFGEQPTQILNLARTSKYLRSTSFQLFDKDKDGNDEIVAALGSPRRSLVILDISPSGTLTVSEELQPASLQFGSGLVYGAAVDFDRDGYGDLIAFSPEGNVLKIHPYYNSGGRFTGDQPAAHVVAGMGGFMPRSLALTDWDTDGFRDVILPFHSGHVLALTMTPVAVPVDELPVNTGALSDLRIADFNQDGHHDMLLVSGDMGMLTLAYGKLGGLETEQAYFTLDTGDEAQVFTVLPVVDDHGYTGTLIAASWNGLESEIFLSDLGQAPARPGPALSPEDSLRAEAEVTGRLETLADFPEISAAEEIAPVKMPPRKYGQPLPAGILPRHVLRVNQAFVYTIPEDEMRIFFSFRWLAPPPRGMFFHYESRSIRWVPGDSQLGAYQLAYRIEMKVGESVALKTLEADSLTAYQVIPELEGYEERLWIYVNDPPRILSEPARTEFIAGESFTYQPLVRDRNVDARLRYILEVNPEGMHIDTTGKLSWQTDSSHVNVYPVRLVVSDLFDRDVQEFKLFARAGVTILSEPPREARVLEPYTYKLEVWKPALEIPLTYTLLESPPGMAVDQNGQLTWTPSAAQIDTQRFRVVVSHGMARDTQSVEVVVNHPPVIRSAPEPMVKIELGHTYDFQIEVEDPNRNDRLEFAALHLPPGMRMDPYNGRLFWEPTRENVDFSNLIVAVTDGRETRMIESEYFVNAPISIVSVPPLLAGVGEKYTYNMVTSDLNQGTLLPFKQVVPLRDIRNVRIYAVQINDDVYRENIFRYQGEWENAQAVYLTTPGDSPAGEVSRLNLKRYVPFVFYEDDRLIVVLETIDGRTVSIKDVLWEFFQGSQGKPPRVEVRRVPVVRYTLLEFPDGMVVDELTGTLEWTPTREQVNSHTVKVLVSDGYTKDEQTFSIYVNHPPTIVSKPPGMALVGELFSYQIMVEDKNADAVLEFQLVKAPAGMQMNRKGRVVWIPTSSQINNHMFTVKVSDGYKEDIQTNRVFVNINPSIISTPKPVALTGYEYRYKVVAEDLNNDRIVFKPVRLPKYARFNPQTGILAWTPRNAQKGPNDVILTAIDERGATTAQEFQIHVFEDPNSRYFVSTGWPLLLTFVGVIFVWGVAQI